MATMSMTHAHGQGMGRHMWLVAGFVLLVGAAAGGYALATQEIQALYVGVAGAAAVAVLLDYRIGAILLVALMPVSSTSLFPHAMMGITGLNPINLLLAATLVAYLAKGRLEHPGPLLPRPLILLYLLPIIAAGALGTLHVDDIHPDFYDQLVINYNTWTGYLRDTVVKPLLNVLATVLVAAAMIGRR